MSYVISTGLERTAATGAAGIGLGAPGYAHPLVAPTEWAELTRPGAPLHWAVLNVARGPGFGPDPHCLAAAGRLTNAGVRVLGHLDLRHGTRPLTELVSDARHFIDWYRVDGFYLDRCPTERCDLADTRRTVGSLRVLLDEAYVVFGHSVHPCPEYVEWADQLVTFSGPWSRYRWSQVAEWTAEYEPRRFCHLVHGVPRTHLEEAFRIARWQGAGTVWFTDRLDEEPGMTPWEALPGFWDDIVSSIGPGVSE